MPWTPPSLRALTPEAVWLAAGLLAQALFAARFLVQWIASERARESVVPVAFWYLSLAGGAMLLAYAVHRRDPVFILGQSMGLFVYGRNLLLIHRRAAAERRASGMAGDRGASR
ncbi:MAG: lipid-A-disaccharide synthase N-terminal domain-containing protein [Candidatus Eisenbacteria bacterium]|uniref:Lipid-A-disaccharide synthase N-terminal domain-containing protein n=1 Tax=Eiseniibacteriota bacterium TaxID=2212470 RepID=A0A937X8S8_UNCEI|nr:lipid-A-disaccharide synthase N-terminal domain-containing protein [Candidatus Eisenbacteria bacterium]